MIFLINEASECAIKLNDCIHMTLENIYEIMKKQDIFAICLERMIPKQL